MATSRILLVAPPWRLPYSASLALGTLSPILREAGFDVDELHGSVLFPATAMPVDSLEVYAKYLFVPSLHDVTAEALLEALLQSLTSNARLRGARAEEPTWATVGMDGPTLRHCFMRDLEAARVCFEAMATRVLDGNYDIVGFSATFDSQVPASLALAKRIRAARPDTKIVLGGAACFEEQADGLIASFPMLDVVCHTEADTLVASLFTALRDGSDLRDVPGIVWRGPNGIVRNPPPTLLRDLDQLPIPDYAPFVADFAESHWSSSFKPMLLFETSRGCWWGQKKLCTFCGLNAEGLAFRSKSPERAYREIEHLYNAYPASFYLQATDNILEMKYLTTVFPRLHPLAADKERPLRMFYEVKSNMKAEHVRAMALAGVDCVQPGSEAFSDDMLVLMNKGCTGLGQIQFIKWSDQENIDPKYNVIVGNPGEQARWYDDMTVLVPFLEHLPPPTGIVNMQLERFSPDFQDPARYGISNVRPQGFYKTLYPGEQVDLTRIAYQFEYDHPDHHDPDLKAAIQRFVEAAQRWKLGFRSNRAFYRFDNDPEDATAVIIIDRRIVERVTRLVGDRAALFVFLDQHRSRQQIADLLPRIASEVVDALLATWEHQRWICRIGDRYLSVLPRRGPPREGGVGLEEEPRPPRPRTLPMVA